MTNEPDSARIACTIYKGRRRPDVYLYLREGEEIERVPEALREAMGRLEEVMRLELHPEWRLAQADVQQVMHLLQEQGYYVQLPPRKELI